MQRLGEEFLLICPDTELAEAETAAERFRRTIEGNRIRSADFEGSVTASLGVAQVVEAMASVDALFKPADEAVYEAKASSRNRVCRAEIGAPEP